MRYKQPALNPLDEGFEKLVKETMETWSVPGLAIGVVDGEQDFSEGYGIAEFPDRPVTPSTLFFAGSTTKAFTAALFSLLVDDNTLQWNTPIASLIRGDFVLADDYLTTNVTIEDALSHRTGIPRHEYSYGGPGDTKQDLVKRLRFLPMTEELRTKYQYTNLMYTTLSHVLETLEKKRLGEIMAERIWEPLGMGSTYFGPLALAGAPEHLAQGYTYHDSTHHPVPIMDMELISGGGSIVSNIFDYTKWLRAMINSSGPMSAAGHQALKSSRIVVEDYSPPYTGPVTYTLGWERMIYHGEELYEHAGGLEAFAALVIFIPRLNLGLVSFANTDPGRAGWVQSALLYHLIDEKLGVPKSQRFDWNALGHKTNERAKLEYDNAAKKYYPSIPDPPLGLSLPLLDYTGTYCNPGYRNVTIEIQEGALYINHSVAAWQRQIKIMHVSGEHFLAKIHSTNAPRPAFDSMTAAEFVIGSDGVVTRFGIGWEEAMGVEGKIWYDRQK